MSVKNTTYMIRDFRFPPRNWWELRSSVLLRSE